MTVGVGEGLDEIKFLTSAVQTEHSSSLLIGPFEAEIFLSVQMEKGTVKQPGGREGGLKNDANN